MACQGKVVSSEVVKRIDKTEDGSTTVFIPHVLYAYNPDGVRRSGRFIQIGLEERGCVEKRAQDYVDKYGVGSRVPVRYDPQNPANAVLEQGKSAAVATSSPVSFLHSSVLEASRLQFLRLSRRATETRTASTRFRLCPQKRKSPVRPAKSEKCHEQTAPLS
jgi:hypothetical protein